MISTLLKSRCPKFIALDVPELKEKLQQTIISKGVKKMVIDLSNVKMITSSGIGNFSQYQPEFKIRIATCGTEPGGSESA